MINFLKKNLNASISLSIIVIVLLSLTVSHISTSGFQTLLKNMCVSFRGPVTIFCYLCICFLMYLLFSKKGKIVLGGEGVKKEYSTFSWLSCLFMAGCGIGIVFYCQEPILHLFKNPYHNNVMGSPEGIAYSLSLFNWTINAWGQYGVLGVIIAYFYFNENRSLKLSSILPARTPSWVKRVIDINMALGVIAGLTTSLGLGVSQIVSGTNYVFNTTLNPYLLIAAIGLIAMWSILSGLKRGVKWLSNLSTACVGILLLVIVLIACFNLGITNFIPYIGEGTGLLFLNYFSYNDFYNQTSNEWAASYPIFFDLWFAAWAAFVAVYVAKISKGRTIREFILGVVGVPIIFTCLWFGIFGCIGIEYKDLLYATMSKDISTSLFIFLQQIVGPTGYVFLSGLVLIIICLFFITSSDSGSYVVAALVSSKDDVTTNEKILWSCIQCCVAMALFYLGGLALIQSVSVIMGILVMLLIGLGSCFFIYHLFKINQSK